MDGQRRRSNRLATLEPARRRLLEPGRLPPELVQIIAQFMVPPCPADIDFDAGCECGFARRPDLLPLLRVSSDFFEGTVALIWSHLGDAFFRQNPAFVRSTFEVLKKSPRLETYAVLIRRLRIRGPAKTGLDDYDLWRSSIVQLLPLFAALIELPGDNSRLIIVMI